MFTKFVKYEQVCKSFARFFDEHDLILTLDRKADLRSIEELNLVKASNFDFQQL